MESEDSIVPVDEWLKKQDELEATLAWTCEPLDTSLDTYSLVTNSNRDVYQGDVVDGKKHGRGILRCSDGSEYRGSWRFDACHGTGWYKSADGAVYFGEWVDNLMEVSAVV